jgi:hypothetical protein
MVSPTGTFEASCDAHVVAIDEIDARSSARVTSPDAAFR